MSFEWDVQNDVFLKALLESPMGVRFSDKDGVIIKVNEGYYNMLGYSSAEIKGVKFFDLIPVEYREQEKKYP